MNIATRKFFPALLAAALAGLMPAGAAEPKHDLFLTVNMSGQGQVMGSRAPFKSGLYRSGDRQTFEHLGPNHIRVLTLVRDPQEPNGLLITALDGVVRSQDGGRTWHILTGWTMTEAKGIVLDSHAPDDIYAGLPDGIAVSRDRGRTWERRNDGIRRSYTHALAVDRTRAGRVLAGTELGIYLTEDGARTWRLVQATGKVTYEIRQSPHDPRVFFAATTSDGALWSTDGGGTWQRIAGVPAGHTLHNCDFDPGDTHRLMVCGWDTGVLVSEDGGRTWSDRNAGLPNREIWSARLDPDIPGRIYAAPNLAPLQVSDDLGRTWRALAFEKAIVFNLAFIPRK
ncbi:MAG: hypothetical protein HY736_00255 [Verrucomicrobia bacterium]|nr:hypothetical protein [Verrucomicrobiota bacterium]